MAISFRPTSFQFSSKACAGPTAGFGAEFFFIVSCAEATTARIPTASATHTIRVFICPLLICPFSEPLILIAHQDYHFGFADRSVRATRAKTYIISTTMDTFDAAGGEFLRISERYRQMSDDELLLLIPQSADLTPFAQHALANEVRSRGLKAEI